MGSVVVNKKIFEELEQALGSNFDMYVEKFEDLLTKTIKDINRFYKNRQFNDIVTVCHTLKSTAGQVGAETLAGLLTQIEDTCKNQKYESITDLTENLKKEAKKVKRFLTNARESV